MEYPKQKRIVDKKLIKRLLSKGYCYMTGRGHCEGRLDPHHIISRGAGGGDTEDNVIPLCRVHHTLAHNGDISKETLREAIKRDKYFNNLRA